MRRINSMRISNLFGQTLREAPADADVISHQLLVRAGFIRQLGTGIFSYLHLAQRSITKIENILREEMNAIGGQEITMPVVHPADVWKETGRWYQIGSEMGRFLDKNERDMVLAMTHEEVIADLVRRDIQSYKQLPRLLYHIQTKWRDDPRPRAGLIRVREFTMKDSYSLDVDWEGLDRQYRAHYQAYFNIFHRCGMPVLAVKSDVGMMGGKMAHEFMYLAPIGEDTLILCDACGYTANRQIARFRKPPAAAEPPKSIGKVATPDVSTIEDLARFLDLPRSKTAKAYLAVATITEGQEDVSKFVFAVVRGDMDVNETKLANAVQAKDLRPAHEEEIRQIGAVPGYASPVGLSDVLVVVDDIVPESPNLVAGANEYGYHLLNVNYGRDYQAGIVADIAVAEDGHACPDCGKILRASRGVEVGNIFKLGTRYSDSMGCTYLDQDGKPRPVIMGSYGIGVGRLLACVAEEYHDDRGLAWPISVAPYQIHLVALKGGEDAADSLYAALEGSGFEVLYDDRDESPGVKFNDADLIGIPLRLTVSGRSLKAGGVELKHRQGTDLAIVPTGEVIQRVKAEISALETAIAGKVVEVRYNA
jgi:prolyl-tRNA synthetase